MKIVFPVCLLMLAMCCTVTIRVTYSQPLRPNLMQTGTDPSWLWAKNLRLEGDSSSFMALRRSCESQWKQGVKPLAMLNQRWPQAKTGDVKSLFIVGLCANEYRKKGETTSGERESVQRRAMELITKTKGLPRNYEFVRMRFLLESRVTPIQMLPIGKLLLKHNPNDVDVVFRFFDVQLDTVSSVNDYRALLKRSNELLRKYPGKKESIMALQSSLYTRLANMGADPTARAKEIAIYEYLIAQNQRRLQTPAIKEVLENLKHLLGYARKHP